MCARESKGPNWASLLPVLFLFTLSSCKTEVSELKSNAARKSQKRSEEVKVVPDWCEIDHEMVSELKMLPLVRQFKSLHLKLTEIKSIAEPKKARSKVFFSKEKDLPEIYFTLDVLVINERLKYKKKAPSHVNNGSLTMDFLSEKVTVGYLGPVNLNQVADQNSNSTILKGIEGEMTPKHFLAGIVRGVCSTTFEPFSGTPQFKNENIKDLHFKLQLGAWERPVSNKGVGDLNHYVWQEFALKPEKRGVSEAFKLLDRDFQYTMQFDFE